MTNTFNHPFQYQSAPVPTAWERFLVGEGIPESKCPLLLNCDPQKGVAIRDWVLANYKTSYVPELVIQTLGLQYHLNSTWRVEQ